jgi:hypothetical protein
MSRKDVLFPESGDYADTFVPLNPTTGEPGDKGSHVYEYTNGMLTKDTWTVNGKVYVKTYGYDSNNNMISKSDWVKQ